MKITARDYQKNALKRKRLKEQKKLEKEKPYKAPDGTRYKSENEYYDSKYRKGIEDIIKPNPTRQDSLDLQAIGRMAGKNVKWLDRPKPKEVEEVEEVNPNMEHINKLKTKAIMGETLSPSDSLSLWNAPIVDPEVKVNEVEKFKPQLVKKKERIAKKKLKKKEWDNRIPEIKEEFELDPDGVPILIDPANEELGYKKIYTVKDRDGVYQPLPSENIYNILKQRREDQLNKDLNIKPEEKNHKANPFGSN